MEATHRELEGLMRAEELRDRLTEALVGLIRTGGTGSFHMISDKDRVFFRGLALSGSPDATEEQLQKGLGEVKAMRQRLTAPKCAGCAGAPDLMGEFSMEALAKDDPEVRALKFLILSGLRSLAGVVQKAMEQGIHDPELDERFYRTMFVLGEDFAEEDLLQIAYGLEEMRELSRKLI